ncbi:MAG: FKBP-type peptidyl-prolyl cis-trans isomerase [Bacteroidota bacterium]|nr:FKBP-type peptidyl-prolyl cis-trans isomerase [Bacteroidota bacterium]
MKKITLVLTVVAALFIMSSCNQQSGSSLTGSGKITLETELDSVSYALGASVAASVKQSGAKELNNEVFARAFADAMADEEILIDPSMGNQIIQAFFQKLSMQQMAEMQAGAEQNLKEGQDFLAKNKNEDGVQVTASGLQYKVIKEASGAKPTATDKVKVHYHGTLVDGTVFDSSIDRGEPTEFPLNQVIKGWTEGIQLMSVGSKFKFFIPSELAYGSNPRPGGPIGADMVLIFDVELLEIL